MKQPLLPTALFLAAWWICPAVQAQQGAAAPNWRAVSSAAFSLGDYQIGPEDLLDISVFEVPELSRSVRVSASGEISLPLLGIVQAAGHSPRQLEQLLTDRLRETYVRDPQVSVFLKEYKSDPVSVVGAVKVPGLYQIQTQKSLIEVLAMAQGLSEGPQILPGRTIIIARKQRPGAVEAADTLEIPIKALLQDSDAQWNVPIYPGDVIKVVPAGKFYVTGDVNQPGGFTLTDYDSVSAIQAVAMAGGTKKTASLKEAVIIRRDVAGNRVEEKGNLKQVLQGKSADAQLEANDILFVPGSVSKEAAIKALEASIQVATGVLVWGPW